MALMAMLCSSLLWAQGGAAVAPSGSRFHVVRAVSGTHGVQAGGRYAIEDPRSSFYTPADKHIIAYFEWEGPVGNHHFEAYWKNPERKVVVISDFSYEAKDKRFAGYWQLDLNETMKPGMWSVEARIDGEFAGSQDLQLIATEKPAGTQPVRHLLEPSEIYKSALRVSVSVDNLNEKGEKRITGSGFFLADKAVLTAFQVINGASSLRVRMPDGSAIETKELLAWNRLQDWAIVKVPSMAPDRIARADKLSWVVGDRCFSLDVQSENSRTIVDENVTGMNDFPVVGSRLNLSYMANSAAIGSPVMNQYGELIGLFGGSIYPGMASRGERLNIANLNLTALATPIDLISLPEPGASVTTLDELSKLGQFVVPINEQPDLLYGILSTHFDPKKADLPDARESKAEFSRKEGTCAVVLVWNPRSKAKGQIAMRLYDLKNTSVMSSKPVPLKLRPGTYMTNAWSVLLAELPPGTYRVDTLQDDKPIWRGYFKVVE
jgi:S1-C subfamily serine protease